MTASLPRRTSPNLERYLPLAVFALAILIYVPALWSGYIWDDDAYVTQNPVLRDAGGLARIWSDPLATPQFYPLTFTTLWLNHYFFGYWALAYHLTNVLLHAVSALLVFRILKRLGLPGAWLGCLLVLVHPVMVESVAWVTERKNTLSLAMALGSFLCFLEAGWADTEARIHRGRTAAGVLLFIGGLLSKTVIAPLPIILVLVAWARGVKLKAPMLVGAAVLTAIGAAAGFTTATIERVYVGASGGEFEHGTSPLGEFAARSIIAGRAVCFYVGKLIVPYPLIFNYPRWTIDIHSLAQWIAPAAVVGVTIALWIARRRMGRWPIVVWLSFLGLLFPALGFVNVFPHIFSWVADHFQYHAAVVLLAAVGVLASRLPQRALVPAAVVVILAFAGLTFAQSTIYYDVETLWTRTLEQNPRSWLADTTLGTLEAERGQDVSAAIRFERSIEWMKAQYHGQKDAGFGMPYYQLGILAEKHGDLSTAEQRFRQTIDFDPNHAQAHANLALVMLQTGRIDEAEAQWQLALTAKTMRDPADLARRAAMALSQTGHPDRAAKWIEIMNRYRASKVGAVTTH